MPSGKKWRKKIIIAATVLFILLNVEALFHSYRLTHFVASPQNQFYHFARFTLLQKLKMAILGIDYPRPANERVPRENYKTFVLFGKKKTECWEIEAVHPKGEVILCHGYGSCKSSLLDRAGVFQKLGYSVLLIDFMGSGGSEGNQTTIGFFESEQVKAAYDYAADKEKNIYLFGLSMGSVAILKAVKDYGIQPRAVILECPYGTMYQTVKNRFRIMGIPEFPFGALLVFWGGIQNGFWGFSHNSIDYASSVKIPTLLMRGKLDNKVTEEEITAVFQRLNGKKMLREYENAGHDDIYSCNQERWTEDVKEFIRRN